MFRLILLAVVLSLPSVGQLFVSGFYGASDDLHIAWLDQFHRTVIVDHQIPPRYVPDLSYGFGYPLFHFTYPLPFAVAETFHLLGANLVDSIKLSLALSLIISAVGAVLLAQKLSIYPRASLVVGMLYLYAPYRATDIYIRGAFGESLAFALFPWLILVTQLKSTPKTIATLALLVAALILTHNISAFLFIPLLALLLLWQKKFSVLFFALGLGMAISSFFWLPAIIDSRLMVSDTVFNPLDHFPTLRQLITPFWGYGASVPGPYDLMSFFQGVFQLLLGGLGLVFFRRKPIFFWSLFCLLVSLFLMNFRSSFLWQSVPLLAYVQFPWRLQFLTLLSLTVLAIPFLYRLPKLLFPILITLIVLVSGFMFSPNEQLGRTDAYFIQRYVPVPEASYDYTQTQEEYLRLPKGATRPNAIQPLVLASNFSSLTFTSPRPLKTFVHSNSPEEFTLTFNRYNFPGWTAKNSTGTSLPTTAGTPHGQITVPVSAGSQTTIFEFTQDPRNKLLNVLSLSTLILAVALIFI